MSSKRSYPRIKATPKRSRKKPVHVKGYCRRKAEKHWKRADRKVKEWGF